MFAVPGWAVSASSLVQEQARQKRTIAGSTETSATGKSKKRRLNSDRVEAEASSVAHNHAPTTQPPLNVAKDRDAVSLSKPDNSKRSGQQTTRHDRKKQQEDDQARNVHKGSGGRMSTVERKRRELTQAEVSVLDDTDRTRTITSSLPSPSIAKLTPLQAKMRNKLTSARFRHLNETLYTTSSADALKLFTSSPDLFSEYHTGFAQQVKDSWPQNPVNEYVKLVKSRGTLSGSTRGLIPLPRRKTGSCTIADLGCGDAPLARGCQSVVKSLQLKFHNYDLHAANTFVTKADISSLPLRDGEADIAVFCLSLMGTNWINFVEEAWRVLRGDGKGEVWVAEVKSRFGRVTKGRVVENSVGKKRRKSKVKRVQDGEDENSGPEQFVDDDREADKPEDETDISGFIKVFTRRGFQLRDGSVNKQNKMFVSMIFTKSGIPTAGKYRGWKWNGKEYQTQDDGKMRFVRGQRDGEEATVEEETGILKPCVYKIR